MPKYNALTWMHFKRNPYDKIAECKICKRRLSYKTTSANLKQHLKLKHGGVFQECLQQDLSQGQHDPPLANASSIKIWNYFEQNQDKGDKIADCRLCQRKLSYKTTITNLKQHLMKKHVLSYNEFLTESETVEIDSSEDSTSSDSDDVAEEMLKVTDVWSYFDTDAGDIAKCVVCKSTVGNEYDELKAHLKDNHPKLLLQILQENDRNSDAASNDGNQDNDSIYTEIVYLEQDPPTETVIKTVEKHKSNTKSFKKREHVRSVHDTEEIPLKKAKNDDEDDELGMFIKYITCLLKKLPADVFSDVQIEILNTILKANSQVTANTSRNIVFNKEQVITRPNIITLDGITPLNTAMTGHNYTITVSPPKEN